MKMEIKSGSKVRVVKDVRGCDTIKKGDIVEVDRIEYDYHYYVKGHTFVDGVQYYFNRDEIELVEEPDKSYIWYLDSEDGTHFLCFDGAIYKIGSPTNEEFKKGKHVGYLLTEEEARKSPFFDKFKKHDPFEKWYYIRMKGNEDGYLNLNFNDDSYSMNDKDEYGPHKTKFTKEECDEIVGTSSILYKEEC